MGNFAQPAAATGSCTGRDTVTVTPGGGESVPVLCGDLTGQHCKYQKIMIYRDIDIIMVIPSNFIIKNNILQSLFQCTLMLEIRTQPELLLLQPLQLTQLEEPRAGG